MTKQQAIIAAEAEATEAEKHQKAAKQKLRKLKSQR